MKERRRHKRSTLNMPVEMRCDDGRVLTLTAHNVSIGGLFMIKQNGQPLPTAGSKVSIKFASASGEYVLQAQVQRLTEDGVVVIFVDFKLEDLQFIEDLVTDRT